jgi:hypothetical protein
MTAVLFPDSENAFLIFLLLSLVLGGAAGFATGRALAKSWRPFWQAPLYMILLAGFVRFLHFALFDETLLSFQYYCVDFAAVTILAGTGYTRMRARQIKQQYGWMKFQ